MKPIQVTFINGPLHLLTAEATWIPEVQIFSDPKDRIIYAYIRDETFYYYDASMSAKLTEVFDKVQIAFKQNPVRITGEASPEIPVALDE